MQELYYTPEDVAKILRMHVVSIRRMCREGQFEGARKFGRDWYIPRTSIDPAPPQKPPTPQPGKEHTN